MSLVLMVFYWVAIPVLALLAARGLLRRAKAPFHKWLLVAMGAAGFLGWFWLVAGERLWLDHQVRELCANDVGIKVYETVALPAERFDKWGNVGIRNKQYANPSDAYYYESEDHYYLQGNPTLLRSRSWIVRRSDGKVMGESIRYGRGGGDLPGPWHGSSFDCPPIADAEGKLESSIFLKKDEK